LCARRQLRSDRSRQEPVLRRASAWSLDPIRWPGNASPLPAEKNGTYHVWDRRLTGNSSLSTAQRTLVSDLLIALGRNHGLGQMRKPDASIFGTSRLMPRANQP